MNCPSSITPSPPSPYSQEIRRLKDMKRKEGLIKDPIRKVGKKKKAKGPNPLAVKKKKTNGK